MLEVISMDKKTMLKKLFARYADLGAYSASARGCHEPTVPEILARKSNVVSNNRKQATSK